MGQLWPNWPKIFCQDTYNFISFDILQDTIGVQELIFTARAQRKLKLYKEAEAGKLKISENVERQLNRAKNKHDKLWTILQGIAESNPECSQKIQKALMHHIYMCAEDSDKNTNSNVQGKDSDGSAQSGRKALIARENSDNTDTINDA